MQHLRQGLVSRTRLFRQGHLGNQQRFQLHSGLRKGGLDDSFQLLFAGVHIFEQHLIIEGERF